eukprot:CAMPEP_0202961538 /NCGR_PEP_ID=MMETSP1396-20130829/5596_1 /ASSEMBLY_ACC=CAM_ASM_000872 /TAXON_ID= /ORGANISM="Pseudokeronopsis sp., Strain Brazil" /LENGTH=86 /DNA_ID=CAMNT_0049681425 /DNA_START=320 /DNA_END=580 /DNA_ORIENTATION=-
MYVRGAYFVGDGPADKNIDFFVFDPDGIVIFTRRQKEEGIFRFNTTKAGTYAFTFSNLRDKKSIKEVTLAIHTPGNDGEEDMQDQS